MKVTYFNTLLFPFAVIFAVVLFSPFVALAIDEDDFESYSLGKLDVVTSGNWGYYGVDKDYEIISSPVYAGSRSIGCDANTCGTPTTSATSLSSVSRYILPGYIYNEGRSQYITLRDENGLILRVKFENDGEFLINNDATTTQTSNNYATSTWIYFQIDIDFVNSLFRANIDDGVFTSWIDFYSTGTGTPVEWRLNSVSASPGTMFAFDNWGTELSISSSSQSITACQTNQNCWNTSDPELNETISTTSAYNFNGSYTVSTDDYVSDINEETFYSLYVRHKTNPNAVLWDDVVLFSGLNSYGHVFDTTATGTYEQCLTLYSVGDPAWWEFWADNYYRQFFKECRNFVVGSANTDQEITDFWDNVNTGVIDLATQIDEGADYVGTEGEMGPFAQALADKVIEFTYLPPWGYIKVFNEVMLGGTTTATTTINDIEIHFPTTSPVFGSVGTTTLELKTGIEEAIANLTKPAFGSQYGDSWETILYYYERIIYILFAFWLLKEVLQFFGLSGFSVTRGPAESRGVTGLRNRGVIDMKASKSGYVEVRKG